MAWYQNSTSKTYVATYKEEKVMRGEVEAAARFGFVAQTMARQGKEWTVTYHRDERTWARIQIENALQQVSQARDSLSQTKLRIEQLQSEVRSGFRAARSDTSNPTQLEKKLLQSVTDLIAARRNANAQRETLLSAYASLNMIRAEAARLQVEVPQANRIDVEAESAPIRSEIVEEARPLEREQTLQQSQQKVVKAVQEWQKVVGDRWGAHAKVGKTEKKAESIQAQPAADARASSAAESKARAAEADLAKHKTKLETIETLLQQREADLRRELEARDKNMAAVLG